MFDSKRSETPDFTWLRAYTMLSVQGLVPPDIQRYEEAWGTEYFGHREAVEAAIRTPGYDRYIAALRGLLTFPLTLYRIATTAQYQQWARGEPRGPVGMTASLMIALAYREALADCDADLLMLKVLVTSPEAILMRGRIIGYEVVVDPDRLSRSEVAIINPET